MATTGFWPVKDRLKEVIDYAENPDKTTDSRFLDADLYAALQYAENSSKTDKKMYVTGINCSKFTAYEEMLAVKRRFGERGRNIAYHGYQSFKTGEVTPQEAHEIGVETARRMWGRDFQVVVTTHLNTDNLHCHFVVNSVSFRDGTKFRNKIGDHYELRKISDQVCRERGKSVLENSNFYGEKDGKMTHREMLRQAIDESITNSYSPRDFRVYMERLGYLLPRDDSYEHPAWTAPGRQRSVRMDSLGKGYSYNEVMERIQHNDPEKFYYTVIMPAKFRTPLLNIEREIKAAEHMSGIQLTFKLFTALLRICTGSNIETQRTRPLSPEMRAEVKKLDKYIEEYKLLCDYKIQSHQELSAFKDDISSRISELEQQRYVLRLRLRRTKSPEEGAILKAKCKELTKEMKPLRNDLKVALRIAEHSQKVECLLDSERQMENQALKNKNREYSR